MSNPEGKSVCYTDPLHAQPNVSQQAKTRRKFYQHNFSPNMSQHEPTWSHMWYLPPSAGAAKNCTEYQCWQASISIIGHQAHPAAQGNMHKVTQKDLQGKAQNTYKRRPLSSSNLPMTSRQATKEASAQTMPTKEEARHPRSSKGKGGQRRMAKSQQAASRQQPHILFMGQALTIQLSARVCSW